MVALCVWFKVLFAQKPISQPVKLPSAYEAELTHARTCALAMIIINSKPHVIMLPTSTSLLLIADFATRLRRVSSV
uniref:Putative secreted protein n=1 Tax=Anopheles marajoara TaxID=58244 RepID=A0A2M4CCW6_9DIPT